MNGEAGWHPVALAAGIDPGTSLGTRIDGREIVVWRDTSGTSHVWEDRCPHRGMRLSFGFVRGNHIACLYHGWQFDAAGLCRFIPAHPKLDVPDTIRVTRFASTERCGIVWASLDAADPTDALPGGNVGSTAVRSIAIMAGAADVRAAIDAELPGDAPAIARAGALIRLPLGGETVAIGMQRLDARETCLHVIIEGAAQNDRAEARLAVSTWAQAVRRRAEPRP